MKIRDLLVIVFTTIVALLLLARAARADGSCPTMGQGGACPGDASSSGGASGASFPVQYVDWMCADTCASICGDHCVVACAQSKDPGCVRACYPVCASNCYDQCTGAPADEPGLIEYTDTPLLLLRDVDGGAP
jgi:hypothetical protein